EPELDRTGRTRKLAGANPRALYIRRNRCAAVVECGDADAEALPGSSDRETSSVIPHRSRFCDLDRAGRHGLVDAVAREGHSDWGVAVVELDVDVAAREAVVRIARTQVIEGCDRRSRAIARVECSGAVGAAAVPRRDLDGIRVGLEVSRVG